MTYINLLIENFRCIERLKIGFNTGSINLVGPSGSGKSTCLAAISWCVYGPIISVTPDGAAKGLVTSVRITMGDVTICRKNNPRRITYSDKICKLEGDDAQAVIYTIFSEHRMWIVEQKQYHDIIKSPEANKTNSLISMAFNDNSHQEILSRIREKISSLNNKNSSKRTELDMLSSNIKNVMKKNKINKKEIKSISRTKIIADNISLLKKQIITSTEKNKAISMAKSCYNEIVSSINLIKTKYDIDEIDQLSAKIASSESLNEEISATKGELDQLMDKISVDDCLIEKLNSNSTTISIIKSQINENEINKSKLVKKIEKIKLELSKLNPLFSVLSTSEFNAIISENNLNILAYQDAMNIAASVNVEYNSDIISLEIEKIKSSLASIDQLKLSLKNNENHNNTIDKINSDINNLNLSINKLSSKLDNSKKLLEKYQNDALVLADKIKYANIELNSMKNDLKLFSIKVLVCPNCNNQCSYSDGHLSTMSPDMLDKVSSASNSRSELEDKIRKLEAKISDYDSRKRKMETSVCVCERDLELFTSNINKNINEINNLKSKLLDKIPDTVISKIKEEISEQVTINKKLKLLKKIKLNIVILNLDDDVKYRSLSKKLESNNKQLSIHDQSLDKLKLSIIKLESYNAPIMRSDEREVILKRINELKQLNKKLVSSTLLQNMKNDLSLYTSLINRLDPIIKEDLYNKKKISINKLSDSINDMKLQLIKSNLIDSIRELSDKKVKLKKSISKIDSNINVHKQLLDVTKSAIYNMLEKFIHNLSCVCDAILKQIFDESISISISTTKILTNGEEKHNIDIIVIIDGIKKSLKSLSGGQKDRISFALAVAVSSVSYCPIVMLDEVLSGLEADKKEKCLSCISDDSEANPLYTLLERSLKSTTFIVTDHHAIEGHFNNVISIV